jgi:hypothetical protein
MIFLPQPGLRRRRMSVTIIREELRVIAACRRG